MFQHSISSCRFSSEYSVRPPMRRKSMWNTIGHERRDNILFTADWFQSLHFFNLVLAVLRCRCFNHWIKLWSIVKLMITSCSIYLLSDTAARKVRNLLTNKSCYIGWVELRAYRQWTGLTQICQVICTFKCHHNNMKHKCISNTRHKKKDKTSSFTWRKCTFWFLSKEYPVKKWVKHLFLVICFNTRHVPLLRNIPPVLQWDGRACDNIFVHSLPRRRF